jgi:DNA mismatch repair ATPase MutS
MSGKSTFLRTIGVNIVLARLGAPVCAEILTLGDFLLFTSMRTTDSLEQHVSSFYAELERISQLIEQLKQGIPTLFLLDELLKGTNSQDRHLGSSTLIRQLNQGPTFGIISTHDLSLGELSEEHQYIQNFSFNSELREGELIFDYKLRHGICESFNATELMARMGIDIEKDHSNL